MEGLSWSFMPNFNPLFEQFLTSLGARRGPPGRPRAYYSSAFARLLACYSHTLCGIHLLVSDASAAAATGMLLTAAPLVSDPKVNPWAGTFFGTFEHLEIAIEPEIFPVRKR